MNQTLQALLFTLMLCTISFAEDKIADNFKRAGFQFDGAGHFQPKSSYTGNMSVGLSGRVGYFLVDNFQFSTGLGYSYGRRHENYVDNHEVEFNDSLYVLQKGDTISTYHHFHGPRLVTSANFYFGYNKESKKGPAHSIGGTVTLGISMSKYDHVESDPQEEFASPPVTPLFNPSWNYTFHYFITPVIAPNVILSWSPDYNSNGLIPEVSLGFSYFIPSRKRVLSPLTEK